MWNEIMSMALSQGVWAALFCCLLFYQIKDGRKRETGYKNTVDALVNRLRTVVEIKTMLEEVGRTAREVKAVVTAPVKTSRKQNGKAELRTESLFHL